MINTTSVGQRRCQFGFCWDMVYLPDSCCLNATILISTTSPPGLQGPYDLSHCLPTVSSQPQQSNPPSKYRTCISLLQKLPLTPDSFRMRTNILILARKPYMTTLLLECLFPSPSHWPSPAPMSSFLFPD